MGCPKNESDSESLERLLGEAGHVRVSADTADLLIVNTCGFIDAAKEESIAAILEACATAARGTAAVAAVGCLVERYRDDLSRELPEVDLFCGFETEPLVVLLDGIAPRGDLAEAPAGKRGGPAQRRPRPTFTYLKVSDGCDRSCTFCAIPLIKGDYQVVPPADILAVAAAALHGGSRELILVGQDVSRYEVAAYGAVDRLLADLAALGPAWLRLLYLQPDGVTGALLEALARYAVPYLDLPLQHASRPLLARMGRRGDGEAFLALLEQVRRVLPEVMVRSTFMVGFPGESEADVEELLAFIAIARIGVGGVFVFDAQEGTAAAALPDQVSPALAEHRAAQVSAALELAAAAEWQRLVGRTFEVLVERGCRSREGEAVGRIMWQAPDVDGVTYLTGRAVRRGQMVRATIDGSVGFDLTARSR